MTDSKKLVARHLEKNKPGPEGKYPHRLRCEGPFRLKPKERIRVSIFSQVTTRPSEVISDSERVSATLESTDAVGVGDPISFLLHNVSEENIAVFVTLNGTCWFDRALTETIAKVNMRVERLPS